MKIIRKYLIACIGLAALTANAQETSRSAYFLDGYSFRHELNPAFAGERNYITMPVLGNFNVNAMSNVGVNTFLYKLPNGDLTTFMNKSVSAESFLGKIHKQNNITINNDITILSAGFKGFKGYNTITIGTRTDVGISLPKGLLKFMKLGQTGSDTRYNFKDLTVDANAMAEIAFGHTHKINNKITVGAKLKFLMGLGNVYAKIDNMDITMSDDKWMVKGNGQLNMSAGKGLYVPTKREAGSSYDTPDQATEIEWSDIEYNSFGMSGFGMGIDLGVTYQLLPDLQLSAAILDLGFMNWNHTVKGHTPEGKSWTFDGFKDVALDSDQPGYEDNKIGQQFDDMWDDLQDVLNFHKTSENSTRTTALAATVHLGAEYKMPFYNKLTGGFLYTSHFNGPFTWHEGRLSA
ncbi:MAG: hypothetical protein K2O12_01355, partial [Muribaculaceae bacterium]|nr:hypothetical protein [Muribaculaceae bacterium]